MDNHAQNLYKRAFKQYRNPWYDILISTPNERSKNPL